VEVLDASEVVRDAAYRRGRAACPIFQRFAAFGWRFLWRESTANVAKADERDERPPQI
jgi:hypothetical protein